MNLVKSFYNSLANTNRPKIDFVKICQLKFNSNFTGQTIILYYEGKINLYLLQLNPISFNMISSLKVIHEKLLTIEPINHINYFEKDFPVLSLISNSEQYNENYLGFYSVLGEPKEIKLLKKKYPILTVIFSTLYFGVGCIHGKIYIHNNSNLDLIFKITQDSIIKVGEIKDSFGTEQTSIIFQRNLKKEENNIIIENDYLNTNSTLNEIRKSGHSKKLFDHHNVLFDIYNNCMVYQILKQKTVKKEENNYFENKPRESIFESIIKGTSKNLSKFTEWSFNSFQNMNQLRKSYNITPDNIQKSTSSKLYLSLFNLNSNPVYNKYISNQLLLPYFNEKIGFIKIVDLYLIVGNRENQMFYIFQYFAPTNNKYSKIKENIQNNFKLIYSIWRGYKGGPISSLNISKDKRYLILTSKKGNNRIYYLPKRENQILEILNYPSYSNKEDTGYEKWNEILNDNIINVEEIQKINHNNYNDTENSLFYSDLTELDQFHLENNVSDEVKNQIKSLNKNIYINLINNGRYFLILNDNFVYFYLIFNNESIVKIKKIELKLNEEFGLTAKNRDNINKGLFYNLNKIKKEQKIEETFDNESTNLSFFSATQLNPLFSVNKLNNWNNNIKESNEIFFYENICNDLNYQDFSEKGDKTRNKDKNKGIFDDNIIEKNIKNVINKNISEFLKK